MAQDPNASVPIVDPSTGALSSQGMRVMQSYSDGINGTVVGGVGSVPIGSAVTLYWGSGSPVGVVTAIVGSLYINTAGGTGTTFYVKEKFTTSSGWVAK